MNTQTPYQNSIASTSMDDHDHQDQDQDAAKYLDWLHPDFDHNENKSIAKNILNFEASVLDTDHAHNEDENDDNKGENVFCYEPVPLYCTDNNPPESYAVCQAKVSEWLNQNTYMERKASVKFAITKNNTETCQTGRSSHRTISLHKTPKLSIIGFRKKPVQHPDGKSKNNNEKAENIRLFRNRSEPGRDYCLLITEPVSPRVSCVGRVGSVRVQGRKSGVWRSFKAVFSNMVQTNRVAKIAA